MKSFFLPLLLLLVVPAIGQESDPAQTKNALAGTWKLISATETTKKSEVRDLYKYEVPDKGGVGRFLAGPFDAVSSKRINDNTVEIGYMKGGKEMVHFRSVVSKDGKTMTNTTKGIDEQGKPFSRVAVWEKQ